MRTTPRQWLVAGLVAAVGAGAVVLGVTGGPGGAGKPTGTAPGSAAADAQGQRLPAERVAAAAAAPAAAPLDPLNQSELQQAKDLAAAAVAGRPGTAAGRQARPEVLHADQRTDKNDSVRTADVYLYDYAADQGVHTVVDLTGNKVTGVVRKPGLQPAPSRAETSRAVRILMDDQRLGPKLKTMYRQATGQDLTSPNDLWAQALIFKAKRATGMAGALQSAGDCGRHRCFQLFLRLPGGKWVDTTRLVIDMSARRVLAVG